MESLPCEVLEDLLLKAAVAIFADSKKYKPLVDITGTTMVVLMSVSDAWWRALTGRWYQATGRQGNKRMLRREFGVRRPYKRLPRCKEVVKLRDPVENGHRVQGICQLNGRLFIVNLSSSVIHVFDATPPHDQFTDISVPGLSYPRDIVACSDSSRLYVADWNPSNDHGGGGESIWRLDDPMTSQRSRPITCDHVPLSLSMTFRRLLVTPYDGTHPLSVHDADGRILRHIRLPGWMRPLHAVETRKRTIIACNRASSDQDEWLLQLNHVQVAEFDTNGNVLTVCEEMCCPQQHSLSSSSPPLLVWPCYAVIDEDNGRVLVADRFGQRIVVLDSDLHVDRVLLSGLSGQPHRLTFCHHHEKQLLIGFYELQVCAICICILIKDVDELSNIFRSSTSKCG